LEVITEFPPIFYSIFFGLAIICAGIISAIIFKKIQDYKWHQYCGKYNLSMDIDKMENALMSIQRHVDNYQKGDVACKDLEIMSISGIVDHQLGHIPRMRGNLK